MRPILIVAIACIGCAAQIGAAPSVSQFIEKPQVVEQVVPEGLGAGEYIQLGLETYRDKQYFFAAKVFRAAIDTKFLNDNGRALSYWHIADCGVRTSNHDQTAEAYHNFVVIAQDILDDPSSQEFIDNLQLKQKLLVAEIYMQVMWSARTGSYGKSIESPILVKTVDEIDVVEEVVALFCKSMCRIYRGALKDNGVLAEPHTERIILVHTAEREIEKFVVIVEK